jgi:acyl-CoA thioester hydrolase
MKNLISQYRIYYEDTDAGGVVYYANYLKFLERSRTEFLRELKINQTELIKNLGIFFVVRSCNVDYKLPATLDDIIVITTKITSVTYTTICFEQSCYVNYGTNNQKHLIKAEVKIACVTKDQESFRPSKIPQSLQDLLKPLALL